MEGDQELMGSGGSSLAPHCLCWHFRLCREERLLVGTEQVPRSEPMGLNCSRAARGAGGGQGPFPQQLSLARRLWD